MNANSFAAKQTRSYSAPYLRQYGKDPTFTFNPKQFEASRMLSSSNSSNEPTGAPREACLASLTALPRITWAEARDDFFSFGVNKESLDVFPFNCQALMNYALLHRDLGLPSEAMRAWQTVIQQADRLLLRQPSSHADQFAKSEWLLVIG